MLILEYIWLDSNNNPRSKTKVSNKKLPENINIEKEKDVLSILELWNFDGSSTGQATTEDSFLGVTEKFYL